MFWLIFSLLALAAAALVVYAAKTKKPSRTAQPPRNARVIGPAASRTVTRRGVIPTGEPYEAVSVVPGLVPCPAARKLRDHRFLIGQEPSLPLADCTSKNCTCRLRQYPDRRHDSEHGDRRLGIGLQTEIHEIEGQPERRQRKRRRKTDT